MASPKLTLSVPGEILAHEVMRCALQEVLRDFAADPYGYLAQDAADACRAALEAVARLEGEG